MAVAGPQNGYPAPDPSPSYVVPSTRDASALVAEVVPILRDDRLHEDDGSYSFDIETANGITASESGAPEGPEGAVVASGKFS